MSNVYIIFESEDRLALVDLESKMVQRIASSDLDATLATLVNAGIVDGHAGADTMIDLAIALAAASKGPEAAALKDTIRALIAAHKGGSAHVPALQVSNDDFILVLRKSRELPNQTG